MLDNKLEITSGKIALDKGIILKRLYNLSIAVNYVFS
jgi:hypothetical protein